MASPIPIYKIKSDGAYGTVTDFQNVKFYNFKATTKCGAKQRVFKVSKYASDYIPKQNFKYTSFSNVEDAAVNYIYDPPEEWAKIDDCGEWPCTAPQNVVVQFEGTTYSGISPSYTGTSW